MTATQWTIVAFWDCDMFIWEYSLLTLCVRHVQIWDFASAEKIKDVPEDIEYKSQVYYSCVILLLIERAIWRWPW